MTASFLDDPRWQLAWHLEERDADIVPQGPPRHVLPLYDGDPPDEPVGARYPRTGPRDALAHALHARRMVLDHHRRELSEREYVGKFDRAPTLFEVLLHDHREIHEALTGEPTPGCRWCR